MRPGRAPAPVYTEFLKTLNSENMSSCQKLFLRHYTTEIKCKKTISVANEFQQKRPNDPLTNSNTNPPLIGTSLIQLCL